MIIRLEYEDIGLVGIRTNYNNKVKNHYIRYIVVTIYAQEKLNLFIS